MRRSLFLLVMTLLALSVVGCGGNKDGVTAKTPGAGTGVDDDPLALLPGGAVMLASVDAKAFFASGTVGAQVAQLAERFVPVGEEAGFRASRDVDRVVAGAYTFSGTDVAAVIVGRFDADKIKQVAESKTPTKSGGTLVASSYAGRAVYTVNNVGFSVLSAKTALCGTETGIRRALDRIHDGKLKRDALPWMVSALETPGAAASLAGDFSTQPLPTKQIPMPLPWMNGMKAARVMANFKDGGTQMVGSFTYPDGQAAGGAAQSLRQTTGLVALASLVGIKISGVDVSTDQNDVKFQMGIDDRSLKAILDMIQKSLGA